MARRAAQANTETAAPPPIRIHKLEVKRFNLWVIGDTPLICHAWSEKAKRQMLGKQVQEIKVEGVEARDPQDDFINSLYDMGDGHYGFPPTAIKKAIVAVAHVDKGIAKIDVQSSVWFDADIISVRPALAGAICDMPLVRIVAGRPEMREDMVRIGSGLKKTANLAYRGQFFPWAINLTGRFFSDRINEEALINLMYWSGLEVGVGEWRNEKSGMMGAYHPADEAEVRIWERFRDGDGPIPVPENYRRAAE
jgi:hypothetical protein